MNKTLEVGKKLVDLCNKGKNEEAIATLYGKSIESIETMGTPEMPAKMKGLAKIKAKNQWWMDNHKVHSGKANGPWPHGDRFAVHFDYDVTPTSGPMKGKRMKMEEIALYTVKNGKIVKEEFFYDMGG